MERARKTEDLIKQYLLGELSADEQVALEDEYFLDPAKYALLLQAEDELIDGYARGSLTATDRERFERCYLAHPQRRWHVKFAQALTQVVDEEQAARSAAPANTGRQQTERDLSRGFRLVELFRGRRSASSLALTTAALLIGCIVVWFLIETSRLRAQLAEVRRESELQRERAQTRARQIATLEAQARRLIEERDRLQAQLKVAEEIGSSPSYVARARVFFTLSISSFRDLGNQEPQTLIIPPGVKEVQLQLNLLESELTSYRVKILTADGREVFSRNDLRPQTTQAGNFAVMRLPAPKFVSGEHIIALSGVSAAGEVENLGKMVIRVRRP